MKFSRDSVELLLDLIEIKISNIVVQDKDDSQELKKLKRCKEELAKLIGLNSKERKNI